MHGLGLAEHDALERFLERAQPLAIGRRRLPRGDARHARDDRFDVGRVDDRLELPAAALGLRGLGAPGPQRRCSVGARGLAARRPWACGPSAFGLRLRPWPSAAAFCAPP